VQQVSVTATVT